MIKGDLVTTRVNIFYKVFDVKQLDVTHSGPVVIALLKLSLSGSENFALKFPVSVVKDTLDCNKELKGVNTSSQYVHGSFYSYELVVNSL